MMKFAGLVMIVFGFIIIGVGLISGVTGIALGGIALTVLGLITTWKAERRVVVQSPRYVDLKKCPKCAAGVSVDAQVCKFCGFSFSPQSVDPPLKPVKKIDPEIGKLADQYSDFIKSKRS